MRSFFVFLGCILLITLAGHTAPQGRSLYVSPEGDDQNPGTHNQPVRTLQHARDLVRAMNQKMGSDITVYLSEGVYRLTEPLTLEPGDSGSNGHAVVYTAAPGAKPVI